MNIIFVVAGASRGFTVLLLGGVVQPWVGAIYAPLGYVWLVLVALAAFAFAARPRTVGDAEPSPHRSERAFTGAAAALGSYVLVLPLVLYGAGELPVVQALGTSLTAVIVGGFAGAYAPRRS